MSKNKQKIFVIRGDLLFTDYQIDSVHTSYVSAKKRMNWLENEFLTKEQKAKNERDYGFAGWLIESFEIEEEKNE